MPIVVSPLDVFGPRGAPRAIEDSRDRYLAGVLQKRFLSVNRERLTRTRNALDHRQSLFFDVLPLLFHVNHPLLPGFVSSTCPLGVSGFEPDRRMLAAAKSLGRSFQYRPHHATASIHGLFAMGSMGTLAQSRHSDFDIWVCIDPELSQRGRSELAQKCQRIERWAESLRLEVHFFIMDPREFRRGRTLALDAESSGSAQRLLLLDEFYRSSLHLAGRIPLWWLVPSWAEGNYQEFASELLDKRFVRPTAVLDFGPIPAIPPQEFVGAGMWQLCKAGSSPYKAILKLTLLESYARNPTAKPLSHTFKDLVWAAPREACELDSYWLTYQRGAELLQGLGDGERLQLLRRALYLKVGRKLSRPPTMLGKSWQRVRMEQLVAEWGWTPTEIAALDRRSEWKVLEVRTEKRELIRALDQSYQALSDCARDCGALPAIAKNELDVLGRKLAAGFGRRPGKLEILQFVISDNLAEPAPLLAGAGRDWQLLADPKAETPLKHAETATGLMLWGLINGVLTESSRVDLGLAPGLDRALWRRLWTCGQQWLRERQPPALSAFARAALPERALLVLNCGAFNLNEPRDTYLSEQSDPFSYGSHRRNLVVSVDLVVDNSWGEITEQRFSGPEAVVEAALALFNLCLPGTHHAPPEVAVTALSHHHPAAMELRMRTLFERLEQAFYGSPDGARARYVLRLGNRYCEIFCHNARLQAMNLADEAALWQHLAEPRERFSPLRLDPDSFAGSPLPQVTAALAPGRPRLFYRVLGQGLECFWADSVGRLVHQVLPDSHDLYEQLERFAQALDREPEIFEIGPAPEFTLERRRRSQPAEEGVTG